MRKPAGSRHNPVLIFEHGLAAGVDVIDTSKVKWSEWSNGRRKSEKHVSCFDETSVAFYGTARMSSNIIELPPNIVSPDMTDT